MMAVLQDSCEFQSVVREVILGAGLQIEGRKIAVNYKAIDIKIGGDANSFLQRWNVAFRIVSHRSSMHAAFEAIHAAASCNGKDVGGSVGFPHAKL